MCMNVSVCVQVLQIAMCVMEGTLYLIMQVSFDLSLARGLDYYTGLIFEATLMGKSAILLCEVPFYLSNKF